MTPVKLNVYISYADDDRAAVEKLRDWLYPMRDEVNVWFNDPPAGPPPLPLPWELISAVLPIFKPYDWRRDYAQTDQLRKERAHVYLFMTSYKSLIDTSVDDDIALAASRRIEGDWLSPRIYPVIVAPALWKEKSRLSQYKPLGPKKTLAEIKPEEEGYQELTKQLTNVLKEMQRDLDEAKFAQSRRAALEAQTSTPSKQSQPYLGDDDPALEFRPSAQGAPPEWLGWLIILFVLLSVGRGLQSQVSELTLGRYENETPADNWEPEYRRAHPPTPPKDEKPFPPPE